MAIATADGKIVEAHGDVAAPVFPRSAIKPIQSLGLLESGAADAFAVPEGERARLRRWLMWEVHVAAMIPVFAVVMARGLGR